MTPLLVAFAAQSLAGLLHLLKQINTALEPMLQFVRLLIQIRQSLHQTCIARETPIFPLFSHAQSPLFRMHSHPTGTKVRILHTLQTGHRDWLRGGCCLLLLPSILLLLALWRKPGSLVLRPLPQQVVCNGDGWRHEEVQAAARRATAAALAAVVWALWCIAQPHRFCHLCSPGIDGGAGGAREKLQHSLITEPTMQSFINAGPARCVWCSIHFKMQQHCDNNATPRNCLPALVTQRTSSISCSSAAISTLPAWAMHPIMSSHDPPRPAGVAMRGHEGQNAA